MHSTTPAAVHLALTQIDSKLDKHRFTHRLGPTLLQGGLRGWVPVALSELVNPLSVTWDSTTPAIAHLASAQVDGQIDRDTKHELSTSKGGSLRWEPAALSEPN